MHTLLCHLGKKELIKDAIQTSSDVKEKSISHRDVEKDLQTLLRQFLTTLSNNCCYYLTTQGSLHVQLYGDLVQKVEVARKQSFLSGASFWAVWQIRGWDHSSSNTS